MKTLKKAVCAALACLMLFTLSSCLAPKKDQAVMTFHGKSLSTNMFSYMLTSDEAFRLAFNNVYLPYAYSTNPEYQSLGLFDTFMSYVQYYAALRDQLYEGFLQSFDLPVPNPEGGNTPLGSIYFDSLMPYFKRAFVINALCEEYGLSLEDKTVRGDISDEIQNYIDLAGNADFLDLYLFEKHGASLDIAREYAEKYSLRYMLTSEYGTGTNAFWNPDYQYLNYLLYEHLFGANGEKRLPESELKGTFLSDYCIVDEVFYSVYRTEGTETELVLDELIKDEIDAYFNENYQKVSYLAIPLPVGAGAEAAEALAEEIFTKLTEGELSWEDAAAYAKDKISAADAGTYCFRFDDTKIEKALREKAADLDPGAYGVALGVANAYVLLGEETNESDLKGVKEEILTALSKAAFDENFFKFNVVFLSYTDETGLPYSEEQKSEIDALGTHILEDLLAGVSTFDEDSDMLFVEDAYKDANYPVKVQSRCVGKGMLQESDQAEDLEEAVLKLSIGHEGYLKNADGYYIIKRLEKESADFADKAVQLYMTKKLIKEIAEDFENAYKNGEAAFEDAESHSPYAKYIEHFYLDYTEYADDIQTYYNIDALGGVSPSFSDTTVELLHVRGVTEDDYEEYGGEFLAEKNYRAFGDYIDGFFDEIELNEAELDLYKASFGLANMLFIPSLEEPISKSDF